MTTSLSLTGSQLVAYLTRPLCPEEVICETCTRIGDQDFEQCLNKDLSPRVYLKLAVMLSDIDLRYSLTNSQEDMEWLCTMAIKISTDSTLASYVVEKLHQLCQEQKQSVMLDQISQYLKKQSYLHYHREIKFIQECLHSLRPNTVQLIQEQIEKNSISLESLVISNIKLSRLIPLLGVVYADYDELPDLPSKCQEDFIRDNSSLRHYSTQDKGTQEKPSTQNTLCNASQGEWSISEYFILSVPSQATNSSLPKEQSTWSFNYSQPESLHNDDNDEEEDDDCP